MEPSHLPCSSLTHPAAILTPSIGVLRWIRVKLVAGGFSNKEIALKLVVTERTVDKHVSSILSKLDVTNRTQATLCALRTGLATLDSA